MPLTSATATGVDQPRSGSRQEPSRTVPVAESLRDLPRGGRVAVLEPTPGGLAARFAETLADRGPVTVFLAAAAVGYVLLAGLAISMGLLLTRGVLRIEAIADVDERFVSWLVTHRGPSLTQASLVGSIVAGGVVIPTLVGVLMVALACMRRWRIAAFLLTAIAVEAAAYRAATLAVHRDRPSVQRMESLAVDASFPSGHTAASIAVYGGIALLLISRIRSTRFRIACWSVALLIPTFVAFARMYRGMHHPLDALGGVVIGVAALLVALFAARAAGAARDRREEGQS